MIVIYRVGKGLYKCFTSLVCVTTANLRRVFKMLAWKCLARILQHFCVFTRESSYCFQRVLAIAIPSVRPSVTRVDQSKTVQCRITKSALSAAWKTLVSGSVKLFHKFEGGHPERGH